MTTRIEIDLDAFRHNVRTLAAIAAPARTMLAVKADGYGHGMLPIARAALDSGADSLAVLDVTAALDAARRPESTANSSPGCTAPTPISAPRSTPTSTSASRHSSSSRASARRGSIVSRAVHLKIDTGLHRNGASPETGRHSSQSRTRREGARSGAHCRDLVSPRRCLPPTTRSRSPSSRRRSPSRPASAYRPKAPTALSCILPRVLPGCACPPLASTSCASASPRTVRFAVRRYDGTRHRDASADDGVWHSDRLRRDEVALSTSAQLTASRRAFSARRAQAPKCSWTADVARVTAVGVDRSRSPRPQSSAPRRSCSARAIRVSRPPRSGRRGPRRSGMRFSRGHRLAFHGVSGRSGR